VDGVAAAQASIRGVGTGDAGSDTPCSTSTTSPAHALTGIWIGHRYDADVVAKHLEDAG
jgi:hypothetical protein